MSDDIYIPENVPVFEAIYGKGLISLGGFEAIDQMFSGFNLKGKTVLDVGSGIGGMAYYLAQNFDCHVVGLEVQAWMASYAKANAPSSIQNQLTFLAYKADGSIPLEKQSIYLCCSKGVLTNVEDKLSLFKQIHHVLKKQGKIVFLDWLVPESHGSNHERLKMGDMSFKETPSVYKQLLEQADFSDVELIDKTDEYLYYIKDLDKMYHSFEHKQVYASVINESLRMALIQANNQLLEKIESGEQKSMLIRATK